MFEGKIAIVDDDEQICETFKSIIEMKIKNTDVNVYNNFKDFEESDNHYNFVVCDLNGVGVIHSSILRKKSDDYVFCTGDIIHSVVYKDRVFNKQNILNLIIDL